jgi:hypothetical protein
VLVLQVFLRPGDLGFNGIPIIRLAYLLVG